jgi:phosphatidylglycerol lysyltransferase
MERLRTYGHGALLPYQIGSDKSFFAPPDLQGAIVYGRAGRVLVILGDPIGPASDQPAVLARFVRQARSQGFVVGVYQATADARAALAAVGLRRIFLVGREAVIDVASFHLRTARRANLRHTVTRFRRGGGQVRWFPNGLDDETSERLAPQLCALDREWHRRSGPSLGFTIGHLDLALLAHQPIAISVEPDGSPVAFATFRPTGADGGCVVDLLRRLPGSVPGAVEASIVEAATAFPSSGVTTLSLGLAPLDGLRLREGLLEERLLAASAHLVAPVYDTSGLAFFKGKFDPSWTPRYGAVARIRDGLPMALGLLWLTLRPSRDPHRGQGA